MKLRSLRRQQRRERKRWWQDRFALLGVGATFLTVVLVFFVWIPYRWQQVVFENGRYVYPHAILALYAAILMIQQRTVLRTAWFWRDFVVWLAIYLGGLEVYWRYTQRYPSVGAWLFWTFAGFFVASLVIELHKLGGSVFTLVKEVGTSPSPALTDDDLSEIKKWRAGDPPSS